FGKLAAQKNPAAVLAQNRSDEKYKWTLSKEPPEETVHKSIASLRQYFQNYALLKGNWDATIAEWFRVRDNCEKLDKAYTALVLSPQPVNNPAELEKYTEDFSNRIDDLSKARDGCVWGAGSTRKPEARRFKMAILAQRQKWKTLADALKRE